LVGAIVVTVTGVVIYKKQKEKKAAKYSRN
jgi:hypothetical protein